MKRRIEIIAGGIRIVATIDTKGRRLPLTRDEVQTVRDQLADELMRVASNTRWIGVPLSRVKVR